MRDPRFYQIAVLGSLLTYGLIGLDFEIGTTQVVVTVAAALLTQAVASRVVGVPRTEWKSALISSLSLCLLLRTGAPWLAAVAAIVAVGSKFVVRARGKHVFNPTNLGLVAMLAFTDREVNLKSVAASEGQKYSDGQTMFWMNAENATLLRAGETEPESCEK